MMEAFGSVVAHFVSIIASLDWMQLLLLLALTFIAFVLWRCQVAQDDFDLRHLMADPVSAKIDRFAFGYLVGLVILSWCVLAAHMNGKLTEWLAGLYVVYCGAPKSIEVWIAAKKAS